MEKGSLKLLAQIAVMGSNNGEFKDAQRIIDSLALTHSEHEIFTITSALNQFNQANFNQSIEILTKWCDKHPPSTAHSLLATAYWQADNPSKAEEYCRLVLSSSKDDKAKALASEIINEMGVTL